MQPNAPVTSVVMNGNIMPLVFQSERFFREAWPQISQSVESGTDAASDVQWIGSVVGLESGARVLDAPCGFGRHSVAFGRRGPAGARPRLARPPRRRPRRRRRAHPGHLPARAAAGDADAAWP